MTKFAAINKERHGGKKLLRPKDFHYASTDTVAAIVDAEVGRAAVAMPLAFIEQAGQFVLVAVLSLTPNQNSLVAPDGTWLVGYVPAIFRAYPFRMLQHEGQGEAMLCVDENSGLVIDGGEAGEDFFTPDGQVSPVVRQVLSFLVELDKHSKRTNNAVAALSDAGLIVPWPITLQTEEGEHKVEGLFRIDEAALEALPDEAFSMLRAAKALSIAYGQLFSQNRLSIFRSLTKIPGDASANAIEQLPETLDGLFGLGSGNDDLLKFD